jgi:TRAP-type C4-dicarboxylate transport system permease small subunit
MTLKRGVFVKAYVITTGAIFGLITVAHVLRVLTENLHLATEPVYVLLTVVSASLCIWAGYLLWHSHC